MKHFISNPGQVPGNGKSFIQLFTTHLFYRIQSFFLEKCRPFYLSAAALLILQVSLMQGAAAQCTNTTANPGTAVGAGTGAVVTIATNSREREYSQISGIVNGATYRFTISNAAAYITVRIGISNGTLLAFGQTPLTVVTTSASNLFVHWNTNISCGTDNTNRTTTVQRLSPTITSLGSASGCPGTSVTINGTNLSNASGVTIGGTAVSAITSNTATQIIATIGSGTTGTVAVTTPGGTANSASIFTVNAASTAYTVTGGGAYCSGGAGLAVGLSGSQLLNNYQLYNGATPVGSAAAGTGLALNFGNQTTAGTYTVVATRVSSGCTTTMNGSATVFVNALPQGSVSGNTVCNSGNGQLTFTATSGTGPFTVVYNNGTADVTATLVSSGTAFNVSPNPSATTNYTLVSVTDNNGCSRSTGFTDGSATVTVGANPTNIAPVAAASPICSGTSTNIQIAGSQTGVTYQLRYNATGNIVGTPTVTGTGATINLSTGTVNVTSTFYVLATESSSGCNIQLSPTVTITVNAVATVTPGSILNTCQSASPSAIALSGASVGGSATTGAWSITSGSGTLSSTAQTGSPATVTFTPAVNYSGTVVLTLTTNDPSGPCPAVSAIKTINVNSLPSVTISPNYCIGGGVVRLTSSAQNSYLWSTGATTQFIDVTTAGPYSVTGTNASGCSASATYNVSQELVVNGNFSSGNTGFTTLYTYTTAANGLYPESYYGVGANANYYHNNFYGTDHTTGTGNFMIINGSPATQEIWEETITVIPNTTYYFSAWATSLNNVPPYAQLSFAVNNVQVGTTATLPAGASSNAGPFTWYQFYGTWNSGSSTTATINIVDLQTAAGGNDFGLDDISFSTLSPATMTVAPASNSPVCTGNAINLTANVTGGNYPLTFSWTGPNSFTSSIQNPLISSAVAANAGIYSLTITDAYGCTANGATSSVTVNTLPTVSAGSSVCIGSTITLSPTTGGTWTSSNNAVATVTNGGVVTGVAAGTVTFTYNQTSTGCSNTTSTVTVSAYPTVNALTGTNTVCAGLTTTFSSTTTGGIYSSSNTGVATVNSSTGVITGVAAGTATISYAVTNGSGCTTTVTRGVTVNANPTVNALTGTNTVCVGLTTTYTSTTAGGTYSSANGSVATVNSSTGVITGVAGGSTNIFYSVTNGSGCTTTVFKTVTVSANPSVNALTGTNTVCVGLTTTFNSTTTGGTYSSSNTSVATVNSSTGVITGVAVGTATISYAVTNGSGCTTTVTRVVTVNANPTVNALTGTNAVCVGLTTTFSSTTTGGTYSSSNTGVATVNSSTGVITGVAAGTATISYAVTNGSGCTTTVTRGVTVNANPTVNALTGTNVVCVGLTTTFTSTTAGGTYSSANGSVATVNSSTGVITGVAGGSTNIFYSVTNGSGCTTTVFKTVTVSANPLVNALTGTNTVCVGLTTTFNSTTTGGTYSSSNTGVATVNSSTGVITGVAVGTATISYAVTNGSGCTTTVTRVVTVNANPTVNALTGTNTVCVGLTTTFSSTTTGGTYSSSNTGVATVNSSTGVITGVAAGTATISYAVTNGSGCTTTVTRVVTVNALPVDIIPTAVSSTVCSGSSTSIQIATSQSDVNYQLRNNTTNSAIGSTVAGNGGTINLPTDPLSSATTYNVLATNATTTCSVQMSSTVTVTVNSTGTWVGGTSGDWNIAGNWCGGVPTTTTDVIIPASSTVNIQTANAVANSVTIAANGSLVMTGANNLTISSGGNFTNNGSFNASASTGSVVFAGSGNISGTTTFNNIDTYGAIDFGPSSTVSGIFAIQPGGSVTGNSPDYICPSATLLYNTSGTFLRGLEWTSSSSGAGCPGNVTIDNNTVINFPVAGQGYICNDLNIENGSSLRQDHSGGSASLKVGRNVTIDGTLSLGGATGGDLYLGGNWTRNTGAIFNHNDRMVIFEGTSNFSGNGTAMSTISAPASAAKNNEGGFGGENFAHIWINKTTAADSVVLLSNITVNREIGFTTGTFSLRNSDVTIVSNDTRTADVAPVTNTLNTSVRYGGTGRFVIQRFIHNPTAIRSWRLLTAPLESASAPSLNEAFQEGVVNPDKNNPDGSGGIYNPWPGYGTHITGPGGAYNVTTGFDHGTNSSSILYGSSSVSSWLSPASTKSIKVTDQPGWMLFVRGDRSFIIGNQYVGSQNAILEPKGKINVGDVVKPVVSGKQVMGNPYASAISLLEVDIAGTAGKNSSYYMWDPKMYTSYSQPGKWVTFTGVGTGFIQTTSESPYSSNGKIESGQAFVIDAASVGNITFHESDKLPLNSSLVGITSGMSARPANAPAVSIFRSDMYVKNGTRYTLTDAVVNIFDQSFENKVDAEDAKKMITFNTKESFSIFRDSVKLAIEKRNDLTMNDTIFFALSKMNELPYQIRFTAGNFNPAAEAYLEDKYINLKTPLNTSGASTYNFDITADPLSKATDRFMIVLKPGLGVVLPVTFTDVKAAAQNKDIAVQWNIANELNIEKYEVQKSINGVNFETVNTIASAGNYNGNRTYNWLDKNATAGVNYYRIRSIDNNKSIQYSRVVKVNMANVNMGITVYPNPVTDGIIKLLFNNMEQGKYMARLMNSAGQLILSKQFDHTGGNMLKNITPDHLPAKGIYNLEISSKGKEKIMLKVIIN